MNLFVRKPINRIVEESEDAEHSLKKTLGPKSLIALGIGAIIGAGIFSLTGIAAAENAGPAVVLSFVVAAVACVFAGMCYSELASMIPVAGSAYTYAYATMGEFIAWIIGWDLVLEYAVASAVVAVSWSRYVVSLFKDLGFSLPGQFTACPFDATPGFVNIPAMLIIVGVSTLLIVGIKESANVNAVIVVVKVAVVLTFIFVGLHYIKPANYHPFIPPNTGNFGEFGLSGIMRAAGIIFFAYIGFDSVSTAAQESRKPSRDIPIGILGSLLICTILYLAFAFVLTGMVNYKAMRGDAAPVATAIGMTPYPWLQIVITFGAIMGLTSVVLVMLLGQSRVFYSMSRDGLLPPVFSQIHPKFKTPWKSNLIFMLVVGLCAGFLPISQLGHMTSIGTLMAFIIVCAGVIVLRYVQPNAPRPYRTPCVPLFPILGILVCFSMMYSLNIETWLRLIIWLLIGLVVYFSYSRFHSRLNR
ncbi:MAG: amino acid permease [Candidatus Omnitrophota bacterium]